jgi:hypothetical protein
MIDRQSRNRLVAAITRYMNEEVMAFAFDDEIHQICDASDDATVGFIVTSLWYHYDDCKDHFAGLSKEEWNYFHRLILLLESNSEIERASRRRWSIRQLIAGMALLCFALSVVWLGFGWHLFGVALAFGPVSILLAHWRSRANTMPNKQQLGLMPFSSFSELRAVRKTVAGFSKRKYPSQAKIRRVHSPLVIAAAWMNGIVLWSFVSPLVLLFQVMPEKEATARIREAA